MSTILFLTQDQLYHQIKLDDIPGIGPRILRRLLKLGITSPNILGETPLPILVKEFGNHQGRVLYNLGRGIDHSPVVRNELMPGEQSFSHSYTLPKEIYTYEDARQVLLELCEMVGRRMRKKGFAGRTIGVFMRFTDMTTCFERKTFKEYTNDGLRIFRIGEWLLEKTWAFRRKRIITIAGAPSEAAQGGRLSKRHRKPRRWRGAPAQPSCLDDGTHRRWAGVPSSLASGPPEADRAVSRLGSEPGYNTLKPIRQVGIWVTNLTHERNLPLPLFEQDRRYLKAIRTADAINDKYGEHTIMRAPILEIYQKVQKIPDGRNKRQFQ